MSSNLIKAQMNLSNLLVPVPTVVTTVDEQGNPNASTLSLTTIIHWKPASIIISVDSKNKSTMNIRNNKKFTINVLRKGELGKKIAGRVGYKSGHEMNKFNELIFLKKAKINSKDEWPPVIDGTILALHCELIEEYNYHGQVLCIGEIKEASAIKELKLIGELEDRSKIWRSFEEQALTHADLYEYLQIND